jgi:hypothetical protein
MTDLPQAVRHRLAELIQTAGVIDVLVEQTDPDDLAPLDLARALVKIDQLAETLAEVEDDLRRAAGVAMPIDDLAG